MEETDPDHHTVPANLSGVAKTNAAADDAALRERLDILLGQLQDPLNLARATPGADLLAFPPRAAPWFRELLATRSDLTWQARASLARAAALLADPTRGRGADGLMPQSQQDYDAMRDGYRHGQDHDPRWDALVERSFRLVCIPCGTRIQNGAAMRRTRRSHCCKRRGGSDAAIRWFSI